jgi:CRISPR/Cas system endoribonuclease Cas6 (RAMP superfamily)
LGGEKSLLAQSIHGSSPARYAISPLFNNEFFTGIRIATLQEQTSSINLADAIDTAWDGLTGKEIRVGSGHVQVIAMRVTKQSTYKQIWEESVPKHGMELCFEMPTRFPLHGFDSVLPTPIAIWQFYELRWRTFSGISLPLEFLTWVRHQVHALSAKLETRFVLIEKEDTTSGIMGNVTFHAFREKKPQKGKEIIVPESQLPNYLRAWQTLASLAEYCGTGEKAMLGMGRTRKLSSFGDYQYPKRVDHL